MISVKEALDTILNTSQNFGTETIPFTNALGRILKENIYADRDFPPFNRVAMDGIAINFSKFNAGEKSFRIEGIQPAGSPQLKLENSNYCIEVMTGAVLPQNTDTVIRYEDVEIIEGIATITIDTINKGQNIHLKGKDKKIHDVLIQKNTCISSAEIGVIATVGKSMVLVAKQPKVMVISTGDELVEVDETPKEYQIRRSNVFTLVSLLKKINIDAETAHITDNKELLKQQIQKFLTTYDVLLFSGAVSKGKFDFLPEIFEELQVEKLFHKVAQRPGKPFWLGIKKSQQDKIVFAFPGNPISTFVSCLVYFYPWYYKSVGIEPKVLYATLSETVVFKANLTYFKQVKLHYDQNILIATPINENGSGDLASLTQADGFVQLAANKNTFLKGEIVPVIQYR